MPPQFPAVAELVPHRGTMCLISRILGDADDELAAGIDIGPDHPFLVPGKGVPTYVGLEMMAQTICAKDGLNRQRAGEVPAIGFLLGCQRYHTFRDWIAVGETLSAHVRCQLDAGELGSFDCTLRDSSGDVLASGTISVYRPRDVDRFLTESGVQE